MILIPFFFLFLGLVAGVSAIILYNKSKKVPTDRYESEKQLHYQTNMQIALGFSVVLLFAAFIFFYAALK